MQAPSDVMENREKTILKMIRRFNAGILKFVMGIKLRSVGATLMGGFAGLSLTSNVIPSALSFTGTMDSFSARWSLGGYAVYSIMAWAVGGWAVQKTGDKKPGAIILGSVGLASGLLFTWAGIGTELDVLLTGSIAALLYGAIGGMIIGDALRNPPEDVHVQTVGKYAPAKQNEAVRLFRFFK
ncbi:MAG: hypothetical protein A2X82_19890 [Geobacteraceae bacterium GWC2_55_20]|nr:MAG: hypothetical protein A2X82_19890 [Geobacteraceae bacterium GWC2_55_20]OGU19437.1 MAG: hypothetical protein A2X85_08160 [Geobacteraceae bacterium GWF2_54_21]HBA71270.1 hypothetical protein [Geobacter sp.]HCE66642.1 hypothetical protein [Geobacter sp.]